MELVLARGWAIWWLAHFATEFLRETIYFTGLIGLHVAAMLAVLDPAIGIRNLLGITMMVLTNPRKTTTPRYRLGKIVALPLGVFPVTATTWDWLLVTHFFSFFIPTPFRFPCSFPWGYGYRVRT